MSGLDELGSAGSEHGNPVTTSECRIGKINPSNVPEYLATLQTHWSSEMARSEPSQHISSRPPIFHFFSNLFT
jgi:hypothetical protein